LTSMLHSNRQGARCLHRHRASACTDVTGFGLLGHLVEMIKPSGVAVELELDAIPVLPGALETLAAGITSSLQPQNVRLRRAIHDLAAVAKDPRYPLLFDPQTAGGLLASVPGAEAHVCLEALRDCGYVQAMIIGQVCAQGERLEPVTVLL